MKDLKLLASSSLLEKEGEENKDLPYKFSRGIACVDNYILVGTSTGDLVQFNCTGETSFKITTISEHTHAIVDLASCIYDFFTLSCDVSGLVVAWVN